MFQAVEHLIRRAIGKCRTQFFQIILIQIGNTPAPDFARAPQRFKPRHGFRERHGTAPMQQVKVYRFNPHPLQAAFTGRHHTAARRIMRIDLGDDENPIAPAGNGITHHFFSAAFAIHLSRVNQGHAKIEPRAQRIGFRRAPRSILTHAPGPLPEAWNGKSGRHFREWYSRVPCRCCHSRRAHNPPKRGCSYRGSSAAQRRSRLRARGVRLRPGGLPPGH